MDGNSINKTNGNKDKAVSDMDLKVSILKYAAALPQLSLPRQLPERLFDSAYNVNRDRELVMAGEDAADFQIPHLPDGLPEQLRVRSRIKGVQAASVDQVARIKVFALRLIKAAMSGGVSWRMVSCSPRTDSHRHAEALEVSLGRFGNHQGQNPPGNRTGGKSSCA